MKEPKYDNDYVLFGFLKKLLKKEETATDEKMANLPKSYGSPPPPPYYKESILSYQNKVYRCKNTKLLGVFSWNDWELIATDDTELNDFIENTYSTDKLELQEQIDGKVETYYQSEDPSISWTTDLEKSKHVGDYWYDTDDDKQYRWNKITTNPITYGWGEVNVPMAVYDLIDTKKSIYTEKPTSYKKDDLWIIESTLPDTDLPIGTAENPIIKGDWVFASQDSDSYDKSHWIKKDEDISKTYLEDHYYNTTTLDSMFEVVDSETTSKINQAKNEIELEVEQTYTTKEETETIVNDYDTQIGTINETITTQGTNISNLSVETDRISSSVSSLEIQTTENTTNINNNYQELNTKFDNYATDEEITQVKQEVNTFQSSTQYSINVINETLENGVPKVQTNKGFTFNDDGLGIDETSSKVKNLLDTIGMTIFDKTGSSLEELLFAGYDGILKESIVRVMNILVRKYLNIGEKWRLEIAEDETHGIGLGFFKIGDDV